MAKSSCWEEAQDEGTATSYKRSISVLRHGAQDRTRCQNRHFGRPVLLRTVACTYSEGISATENRSSFRSTIQRPINGLGSMPSSLWHEGGHSRLPSGFVFTFSAEVALLVPLKQVVQSPVGTWMCGTPKRVRCQLASRRRVVDILALLFTGTTVLLSAEDTLVAVIRTRGQARTYWSCAPRPSPLPRKPRLKTVQANVTNCRCLRVTNF